MTDDAIELRVARALMANHFRLVAILATDERLELSELQYISSEKPIQSSVLSGASVAI